MHRLWTQKHVYHPTLFDIFQVGLQRLVKFLIRCYFRLLEKFPYKYFLEIRRVLFFNVILCLTLLLEKLVFSQLVKALWKPKIYKSQC